MNNPDARVGLAEVGFNENDLRGKNFRDPSEPDGTYTIPSGNLFPPGTPNTKPEFYS